MCWDKTDEEYMWQDLGDSAEKVFLAAKSRNREELVEKIFYLCAEMACQEREFYEHFGWDPDNGLICRKETDAEGIANLFTAMSNEYAADVNGRCVKFEA